MTSTTHPPTTQSLSTRAITVPSRARSRRPRRAAARVALLAMIVVGVLWIMPLVWVIVTSLTSGNAFSFDNYVAVFVDYGIGPNFLNSIMAAIGSTITAMVVGVPAAYALSRFAFKGRHNVMFWFLGTRMAPPVLVGLPFFLISRDSGIYDTVGLLIIVYTVVNLSWVVFMMRSYFDDIPAELEEAAYIDGVGRFGAFRRVILPLAVPGMAATALFCIITAWNEYFFALTLTSINAVTLPASLTSFLTIQGLLLGPMSAASVCVMLPILVLTLWLQKHLVRGMTLGAIK